VSRQKASSTTRRSGLGRAGVSHQALRQRRREAFPRLVNFEEWRRRTSRMRAEKMRTLAEDAIDSTVRAMMVGIAADYDRLAESVGDRAAHDTIMFGTPEVRPEG
jgi:hypothetical protein